MNYIGDFQAGATVHLKWNTTDQGGARVTPSTAGSIRVYKDDNTTQTTTGVTDTRTFDTLIGVHHCKIVTTDAFYVPGADYMVVLSGSTVDGQNINAEIASFSIENRPPAGAIVGVVAASPTPTTTVFGSAISGYQADSLIGRLLVVTSGTGVGNAQPISDFVVASGVITLEAAITVAPSAGDRFIVV